MKNLKSKATILMAALMITAMSVQAQQRGPGHGKEGDRTEMRERGERGKPGLPPIPGLTEEQKEQMKAIHLEVEKASLPVRNEIGEKEARLRTLITADSYDEKAINKLLEEVGDLKTDMEKIKVASIQKVKNVLNEEQLLVFYKHMDKKPGKGKGPRGRGR